MNNLKKIRQEKGVKQKELATFLNIAQSTLSYWEQGKYDIDNENLKKLALYFQTSTDYLLGTTTLQDTNDPSKKQEATGNKQNTIKKSKENNLFHLLEAQGTFMMKYPPEALKEIECFLAYINFKYGVGEKK